MHLTPFTPANVALFKSIRLRALHEDPHAFGSSYAREAAFDDEEWLRRVARWSGDRGLGLVALEGETPKGMVGLLVSESDPHLAEVVSMWVVPEARRSGVARTMLSRLEEWAREHSVQRIRLGVTKDNNVALAFYQRSGYELTEATVDSPGVCGCEHTLVKHLATE